MDYFPFSGNVIHFARGPLFIGFTNPLILDPHHLDGLSSQFWLRPGKYTSFSTWISAGLIHLALKNACVHFKRWSGAGRKVAGFLKKHLSQNGILMQMKIGGTPGAWTRHPVHLADSHQSDPLYIIRDRYLHEASNLSLVAAV